jgi:hypothetical protein
MGKESQGKEETKVLEVLTPVLPPITITLPVKKKLGCVNLHGCGLVVPSHEYPKDTSRDYFLCELASGMNTRTSMSMSI